MTKTKSRLLLIFIAILFLTACTITPTTPYDETPPPPTSTPKAIPTQPPTETTETKSSVLLISWDGSRADLVYGLMEQGVLPHFSKLAEMGVRAEYAQSIDPSLTAAAHNSMSSGAFPRGTGIVSNSYHVSSDDFYWYRKGYDEEQDQTEPIWVTAKNAGLTSAAVFFVGGSPDHSEQLATYTLGYGVRDAYSKQRHVEIAQVEPWENSPDSFSTALGGSFSIQNVGRVYLLVIDSTDDQMKNYDTVLLNTEKSTKNALTLKEGEWGSLILLKRLYAGADFKIQEITAQEITLYHTNVYHNNIDPPELRDQINQRFGYFPASPDSYAYQDGWIDAADMLHMLERQSEYIAQVTAWIYQTYQPDLLMTWFDNFDSAGHNYLMVNERQTNYSPETAAQFAEYYKEAAKNADQALATILDAVNLEHTTVMLVGDHGMAPIHSVVYVNTILEQAGLLTLDTQNYVVVNKTKAFAVASGGAVHIYINLIGREKDGIVPADEYEAIQTQIVDLFANLTDPETGETVFQRVLTRDELATLGLDHPNAGDVFAQANPGYHLDGWRGNDFVFAPADFYGQHGYDSNLPEMRTIFIAAGQAIRQHGEIIPPVRIIDYVPTIANLLGFEPAAGVEGKPIEAIIAP